MLADNLLQHVLSFSLKDVQLPKGVGVLDPFQGEHAAEVQRIVTLFHRKFYSDERPRVLMLGINPGRFGAGLTGIAFTDPGDVREVLGIRHKLPPSRPETSSQFFKQLVGHADGPDAFYRKVYVHSVFPFGFTTTGKKGKEVNLNYYDRKDLMEAVRPHATQWLNGLVAAGCRKDIVLCLGKGKNYHFLKELDIFKKVVALEHPRFIMQYKAKSLEAYIAKYVEAVMRLSLRT